MKEEKIISNAWMNDHYDNINIPYLFNKKIYEYDMKDAGYSLVREFNQLPKDKIDYLASISDKYERKVQIGNYERQDPIFNKNHSASFALARKMFFEINEIEDNDVICIKKDAIFTTKKCKVEQVGKYILFRIKNEYTSYLRLKDKRFEFYYNGESLDIKGISDENYEKHKDGVIKFFNHFFMLMETEEETVVLDYLRNFITKYKRYELPLEYYRTFNHESCYTLKNGSKYDEYWEEDKRDIDFSLNFNIFIKLIKVII